MFDIQVFLDILVGAFSSFNAAINAFSRFLVNRMC